MVGLKEESKLCSLLGKFAPSLSTSFEILSIDVDGIDYFIWKDFLEEGKYKPKIVVIEFNPTIPNHVIYIQGIINRKISFFKISFFIKFLYISLLPLFISI